VNRLALIVRPLSAVGLYPNLEEVKGLTSARKLAGMVHQAELKETFERLANNYDEIAEDLETGAFEIRHPELLAQDKRER
jgi:hypothetical protein